MDEDVVTYAKSRSKSGQRRPVVARHMETVRFFISLLPCDTVLLTILFPSQPLRRDCLKKTKFGIMNT